MRVIVMMANIKRTITDVVEARHPTQRRDSLLLRLRRSDLVEHPVKRGEVTHARCHRDHLPQQMGRSLFMIAWNSPAPVTDQG